MAQFRVGFSKQRKKPGGRRSSNCVRNAFFQLSPSGRNEKTPLGSNFTISVSCHHFGWAFPSSGKSRIDEGRPIAFKTRFFNFPHRGETKKHPWDRILQFRFHATILGGFFEAAEEAGCTKVVQLRSKCVFSTFPVGAKRKNTLGIKFYNFGFMPPFWVGFCKQRKKPGSRRSTNYVQNAFFQLSPSGRNEKTPLGSNITISVSCHHFGWAFPSSGKSRIDEGRPIAFKTRFFNFPHRGETEKHPWDRILQFRFHATILGGLFQAAEKAGLTKVVQLRSKRVFSTFPIGAKRKNTLAIEFYNFGFMPPFWVGFTKQRKKPGSRRSTSCVQNAFSQLSPSGRNEKTPLGSNFTISVSCDHFGWALPSSGKSRVDEGRPIAFKTRFFNFPLRGETKKHPRDRIYNFSFMAQFRVGFSKQRKKPGGRRSSNCVRNAFFQLSPSGRNEKTPLGSNFTISVSCHHFGWAFPSSGKSRVDEGRPIAFKTRFFNFPHRGETKKHPWDRILQFRFHATILGGLFQAAEKAGCTKVVQLRSKRVFSTFPIGAKRKNTLGIEFYNFGFMPPFWVGFSKQRKKPGGRRSTNCVQNAFFQLSPSGRNEKTPLGSNITISVSCHHFGWVFRSSGRSRVYEGRPIAFKMRFFNFPRRGETKKHPWDRILQFRFHATILGGLFQAAEKAGWRRSSNCVQNAFFQLSPSGRNGKTPLGSNFTISVSCHHFGWVSKQRKKPDWRRSSNCVQNAFFQLSPTGQNGKTPLGSNFTISVSCHHFGWAFPSSGKSRVHEGRPIAFKTRFFNFPHRGETKKHPWDRILQFRFHATILGGLFQAAEKAGWTKVDQLRSKRVFSTFPIGAKRKNTLGIEYYNFGFMPPFWVGFSKQRKKPGVRRSSKSRVAFKMRFFNFPRRGKTKKHPRDRILQFRFYATILGGLFQAAEKAGLTKVVQLRSKRVFSTFPIGAKRKNTLGIEFYNFGFMPPFWVGFSKQRKKPDWRRSSNCVQNAFFQLSPTGQNGKTPLGSNFTISVSCHHFGWALPSSEKSRVHEGRPVAFKTRFLNFPHRGETKKHPWDRILQFRFHGTISGGLFQAAEKAGWTKVVEFRSKRVFSTFPIGAKRKNTLGIEFYNFGFMPPFWVGFSKQRKKPGGRRSSNCVQNAFFQLSPSGRNEKTP